MKGHVSSKLEPLAETPVGGSSVRKPTLYETIDWAAVANSLEQSALECAAGALRHDARSPASTATYGAAALVTDALARAIREGLE